MNTYDSTMGNKAKFLRIQHGIAYYAVTVPYSETLYSFPVPLNTMRDEVLVAEKNVLYFMNHIRQAIYEGTFLKEAA